MKIIRAAAARSFVFTSSFCFYIKLLFLHQVFTSRSFVFTSSKIFCFLHHLIEEINTTEIRGGSRAAATSKIERFVIIFNGFQPLAIITKHSILNVTAALDPPLILI